MNTRSKIFLLAAAVLLLATGAFAQHDHGKGHGKGQEMKQGACPHMTATSASLDKAIALLEQAKTDPAGVDKALTEVRAAKAQVTECQEMCQKGMCGGHKGGHAAHGTAAATAQPAAKKVTDPVCGMEIDPATAAGKSVYAGKTYYFCSKDEKAQFDKDPEKYLKKG
ncbi:MAG TPA: YHS domain-containing protein [Thermoanaerobaculia bacterium]|nr:YHS domain-containing protein [Thermoanaerobaculia bacterium]